MAKSKTFNLSGGAFYEDADRIAWGRIASYLKLIDPESKEEKSKIILTPEKSSDSLAIISNSDGIIEIDNPIPDSINIQIEGRTIIFTQGKVYGEGIGNIKLLNTDHFRRASKNIDLKYYDGRPHSTNAPLDKVMMDAQLANLTGTITFSRDKAPVSKTVSLNPYNSVVAKISGQNAVVYSQDGGGVAAPEDSSMLFSPNHNGYRAKTLNLDGLDTHRVTDMRGMFESTSATSLNLRSFDTSEVTNMERMFTNSAATSLDLSSFDTFDITNMFGMFTNSAATSLDLSSFDMSNVTNTSYMFQFSKATTVYCRTQSDKDKMIASSSRTPAESAFIVGKPV